jgi:hypothetical protein
VTTGDHRQWRDDHLRGQLLQPHGSRDWRVMSGLSASIVALFVEMYGATLTIHVLAGRRAWLAVPSPQGDPTRADTCWNDLIGWNADPRISPFHILSYQLLIG